MEIRMIGVDWAWPGRATSKTPTPAKLATRMRKRATKLKYL